MEEQFQTFHCALSVFSKTNLEIKVYMMLLLTSSRIVFNLIWFSYMIEEHPFSNSSQIPALIVSESSLSSRVNKKYTFH